MGIREHDDPVWSAYGLIVNSFNKVQLVAKAITTGRTLFSEWNELEPLFFSGSTSVLFHVVHRVVFPLPSSWLLGEALVSTEKLSAHCTVPEKHKFLSFASSEWNDIKANNKRSNVHDTLFLVIGVIEVCCFCFCWGLAEFVCVCVCVSVCVQYVCLVSE